MMPRQRGDGGNQVRWVPPKGEGRESRESGKLHIGAALLEALGWPERLSIKRTDVGYTLAPESRFGLKVIGSGTSRRLAIGAEASSGLQLPEAETTYDAHVGEGVICLS